MRPTSALTAALAAAVLAHPGPASSAPPVTVLVAAPVGEGAQQMMPAALWLRLVSEDIGPVTVVSDLETTMPDQERCRAAHAAFAVLATFDRAPRLPGIAQDTDRAYAVARLTVRNCATGVVSAMKIVRLESDPIGVSERLGPANAERLWTRPVRATLAREPLGIVAARKVAKASASAAPATMPSPSSSKPPTSSPAATATVVPASPAVAARAPAPQYVAHVSGFRDGIVYLADATGLMPSQVVYDIGPADRQWHEPIELVIDIAQRRLVTATVLGRGTPHAGDIVTLSPPSPTPEASVMPVPSAAPHR